MRLSLWVVKLQIDHVRYVSFVTYVKIQFTEVKTDPGKGITIGVIDAGFLEAPSNSLLKHIFDRKAILDKRDYVNPPLTYSDKFYTTAETFSDFHGTEVMSAISGANRSENAQNGMATESQFYLARTDHGTREFRGEEDN